MKNSYGNVYPEEYNYMERVNSRRISRMSRVKTVRRQKILFLSGVIITLILCVFFTIKAFAAPHNDRDEFYGKKQYKSVVIYCGDDLNSIAEEYCSAPYSSVSDYSKEIQSINHISEDTALIPGNYLVIPYYL